MKKIFILFFCTVLGYISNGQESSGIPSPDDLVPASVFKLFESKGLPDQGSLILKTNEKVLFNYRSDKGKVYYFSTPWGINEWKEKGDTILYVEMLNHQPGWVNETYYFQGRKVRIHAYDKQSASYVDERFFENEELKTRVQKIDQHHQKIEFLYDSSRVFVMYSVLSADSNFTYKYDSPDSTYILQLNAKKDTILKSVRVENITRSVHPNGRKKLIKEPGKEISIFYSEGIVDSSIRVQADTLLINVNYRNTGSGMVLYSKFVNVNKHPKGEIQSLSSFSQTTLRDNRILFQYTMEGGKPEWTVYSYEIKDSNLVKTKESIFRKDSSLAEVKRFYYSQGKLTKVTLQKKGLFGWKKDKEIEGLVFPPQRDPMTFKRRPPEYELIVYPGAGDWVLLTEYGNLTEAFRLFITDVETFKSQHIKAPDKTFFAIVEGKQVQVLSHVHADTQVQNLNEVLETQQVFVDESLNSVWEDETGTVTKAEWILIPIHVEVAQISN